MNSSKHFSPVGTTFLNSVIDTIYFLSGPWKPIQQGKMRIRCSSPKSYFILTQLELKNLDDCISFAILLFKSNLYEKQDSFNPNHAPDADFNGLQSVYTSQ